MALPHRSRGVPAEMLSALRPQFSGRCSATLAVQAQDLTAKVPAGVTRLRLNDEFAKAASSSQSTRAPMRR